MIPQRQGDGEPALIAHNEDASLTVTTPWFFAQVSPAGSPAFTSLCYAGRLPGTACSVNDAGLIQTINDVRTQPWQIGVPRVFLARAVLACRDSVSALDLIRATVRASGYHHAIGTAVDGKIHSVEAPASDVVVREVCSPAAHANHLIYEPLSSAPQYVVGGSRRRQAQAEAALAVSREAALMAMRSSAADERTLLQSPTAHNDWHKTLATAVFEFAAGKVAWSAYAAGEQTSIQGFVG
jgi:hypothetical protein